MRIELIHLIQLEKQAKTTIFSVSCARAYKLRHRGAWNNI